LAAELVVDVRVGLVVVDVDGVDTEDMCVPFVLIAGVPVIPVLEDCV
jgi:hypothetical protein